MGRTAAAAAVGSTSAIHSTNWLHVGFGSPQRSRRCHSTTYGSHSGSPICVCCCLPHPLALFSLTGLAGGAQTPLTVCLPQLAHPVPPFRWPPQLPLPCSFGSLSIQLPLLLPSALSTLPQFLLLFPALPRSSPAPTPSPQPPPLSLMAEVILETDHIASHRATAHRNTSQRGALLYCTTPYDTLLYCTVLYFTMYCTVPYCPVLHCTVYCTALHVYSPHLTASHPSASYRTTLHRTAPPLIALHRHHTTLHRTTAHRTAQPHTASQRITILIHIPWGFGWVLPFLFPLFQVHRDRGFTRRYVWSSPTGHRHRSLSLPPH
jgi:hypothetical protein